MTQHVSPPEPEPAPTHVCPVCGTAVTQVDEEGDIWSCPKCKMKWLGSSVKLAGNP